MPSRVSEKQVLKGITAAAKQLGCGVIRLALQPSVASGWPDLLILVPGGRPLFIEVKAPGEVPSPMQEHRIGELLGFGYPAFAIDNVDEARDIIALATAV